MSENPTIKLQNDKESPPNISAEVPGEQKIRETDVIDNSNNSDEVTATDFTTVTNTSSDTDFTLSPVITVTKNETTLTKGDMKLQKVTVTEDIARQKLENGDRNHSDLHETVQTNKEMFAVNKDSRESPTEKERRSIELKKSRIPKLKFRQTVERVKRERREQKLKEQPHDLPRRSSIPRLKDKKKDDSQESLKPDWQPEEYLQTDEKLDEEFEKIYEEIVDNKQVDIDEKILAVKIDDPEKVETKFEQIIHAYDSSDDNYLTQTEKLRVSKIPWRKKDYERSASLGSSFDKLKNKNTTPKESLKDGGYKISASTITTKRFSRGHSTDLSNEKIDIFEPFNNKNEEVKETVISELVESVPVETGVGFLDRNDFSGAEINKKDEYSENISKALESIDDGGNVTKDEITIKIKTGIPVKPQRINRGISRDLNKRPVSLEDKDFVNKEVVKHEELIEGNSKIIKTEKITRGISRSFSRDGKSITVPAKTKQVSTKDSKIPVVNINKDSKFSQKDLSALDINKENINSETNHKHEIHTGNITKDNIKIGIPVYTKTTHSYTKGIVQNVEMIKTIEWKQAPEIKMKRYSTSYSENTVNDADISDKPISTIVKDETTVTDKIQVAPPIEPPKKILTEIPVIGDDNEAPENVLDNPADLISDKVRMHIALDSNMPEALYEKSGKPIEIRKEISDELKETEVVDLSLQDNKSLQNVTILKGNVNRLINQISVNETTDVVKKETNVQIEIPKKKSVLGKIAIFEGKDPSELNIKTNKLSKDSKSPELLAKNNSNEISKVTHQITKPQEKLVRDNNVHKHLVSNENNVVKDLGAEPIIVDQIWKIQEQDLQNIMVLHKIEEVRITPEIADFSLRTNTDVCADNTNILPNNKKLDSHEMHPGTNKFSEIEPVSMTDNTIKAIQDIPELQTADSIQLLPTQVDFVIKEQIAISPTIPAKIDFIFNEDKDDVVKYSPEQVVNTSNDKSSEREKSKVGKIDLNFWKKKVATNEKLIWSGKSSEPSQIQAEKVKSLVEKDTTTKNKPVSEFPKGQKEIVLNSQEEMPTILPGKMNINLAQDKESKCLPNYIFSNPHDSQLQVPVVLPETPLTRPEISNYETQFILNPLHIEIPTILPGSLKTKTINQNPYVNETKSPSISKQHTVTDAVQTSETVEVSDTLDREIPSDPELVDSEPEIKDNKETIMGKLKNKIYLITNKRNINKSVNNPDLPKITTPNVINTSIREKYNNSSNLGNDNKFDFEKFNYNVDTHIRDNNEMYVEIEKSDYGSREDLRRAKSLAELDLGDAVKGQVQRMVYRIKSVDFEKTETHNSNKINAKEMPKKSSVLEKIALFERKAASTYHEIQAKPRKLELTISSNNENKKSSVLPDVDPEQAFLQKVEGLSTAKLRYEKTKMEYVELVNGEHMPVIALGTAIMDNRLLPHIISSAIDLGFRAIDTAYIYGNEREVGIGIKMKIDDGTVQRKDLYIISKLWSTYHHPELVETACRSSLEALGLEYFDLFLIHNPMSFKEGSDPIPKIASVLQFSEHDYLDAWFAMEELVRKGLVRSIGVSNFNSKQIQRILDKGRIKPVVNQVECHPYLSQERLHNFCAERNIHLQCFGVLGATGTPTEFKSPGVTPAVSDPLIKVMASALNVSAAQLLVRYQLQSFRSVVVKSSSAAHLWEILQTLSFQLQRHEVAALSALNKNERIYTFKGMGDTHKNYPFREPF